MIFWQGEGEKKNSQHKITVMVNSQLCRHMTLKFHRYQHIRHIESTNPDFMTIPGSQNIAFANYNKIKREEKGH